MAESHLIPLPSLHGREVSSFLGCVPADDIINSMVGVKPLDSSVVVWYQVDEFTAAGQLSASLLDHTFTLVSWEKCQHLPNSHLNWVLKTTPFWTKLSKTSHGLDSIFTDCVDTPELDAFFGETDCMSSSVS